MFIMMSTIITVTTEISARAAATSTGPMASVLAAAAHKPKGGVKQNRLDSPLLEFVSSQKL